MEQQLILNLVKKDSKLQKKSENDTNLSGDTSFSCCVTSVLYLFDFLYKIKPYNL